MSTARAERPTLEQLDREIARMNYNRRFLKLVRQTLWVLVVVVAIAAIGANYFLSIVKVEGTSMTPTLEQGELLITQRTEQFETGDIIAFYYNNKLLLKRVIAGPGDWVDIDESGQVFVNSQLLEEPYIQGVFTDTGDLEYPYQVPESHWFVMGDHRTTSLDSRYTEVGDVTQEQVFGKVLFRIWPLPWAASEEDA
jgi:signal peptidase I